MNGIHVNKLKIYKLREEIKRRRGRRREESEMSKYPSESQSSTMADGRQPPAVPDQRF